MHDLKLFMMDGQKGWRCGCGVTEYWQPSLEAAVRRWQNHCQFVTGERRGATPDELRIRGKDEL